MITLILGGARSGKSALAERLAAGTDGPVTYVATAHNDPTADPDFAERIRIHRDRRPASWRTDEPGSDLLAYLEQRAGHTSTFLIDSLGTWLAGQDDFRADGPRLAAALGGLAGPVIVVSDEVGLAVHPSTEVGGRFRDGLGRLNQEVSRVADHCYLVVAGRALELPPYGAVAPDGSN